jgi:hypothetical protein
MPSLIWACRLLTQGNRPYVKLDCTAQTSTQPSGTVPAHKPTSNSGWWKNASRSDFLGTGPERVENATPCRFPHSVLIPTCSRGEADPLIRVGQVCLCQSSGGALRACPGRAAPGLLRCAAQQQVSFRRVRGRGLTRACKACVWLLPAIGPAASEKRWARPVRSHE